MYMAPASPTYTHLHGPPVEESYLGFNIPSGGRTVFKIEVGFMFLSALFILCRLMNGDNKVAVWCILMGVLVAFSLYHLNTAVNEGKPNCFLPYILIKIVQLCALGIILMMCVFSYALVESVTSIDNETWDKLALDGKYLSANGTTLSDLKEMKAVLSIGKPFLALYIIFITLQFVFSIILTAVALRFRAYYNREIYNNIAGESHNGMGPPPPPNNIHNSYPSAPYFKGPYDNQPIAFERLGIM